MRRATIYLLGAALVVTLVGAQPAAAGTKQTEKVRSKSLSRWGSSDTTGLTYQKQTRRLLISDADVDETSTWRRRNFFISTLSGRLVRGRKLFTMEPEDLAWDGRHRNLYVTNDDTDIVYRVRGGRDRKFGTRDDKVVKLLDTHRFRPASFDPEGLAVRVGRRKVTLIVTDATNDMVYKVGRGRDRRFGTRDDTVRSFGMRRFGFSDTEDVWYDGKTGHLFVVTTHWDQNFSGPKHFIAEVTWKRGRLVNRINYPAGVRINASGIVIAPASRGRGRHFYLTDSGKRAEGNPGQNDGRLWELRIT
jgi:hypothetical protein